MGNYWSSSSESTSSTEKQIAKLQAASARRRQQLQEIKRNNKEAIRKIREDVPEDIPELTPEAHIRILAALFSKTGEYSYDVDIVDENGKKSTKRLPLGLPESEAFAHVLLRNTLSPTDYLDMMRMMFSDDDVSEFKDDVDSESVGSDDVDEKPTSSKKNASKFASDDVTEFDKPSSRIFAKRNGKNKKTSKPKLSKSQKKKDSEAKRAKNSKKNSKLPEISHAELLQQFLVFMNSVIMNTSEDSEDTKHPKSKDSRK